MHTLIIITVVFTSMANTRTCKSQKSVSLFKLTVSIVLKAVKMAKQIQLLSNQDGDFSCIRCKWKTAWTG